MSIATRKKYISPITAKPVLGCRIQELRRLLNLSKTQFALGIGYTCTQVLKVENGTSTASATMCERIVDAYDVRAEWLCGADGEPWIDKKIEPQITLAVQRLRKVYEDSGLSQREFCKRIGASTTSLTEQFSGKREITVRFAQRIEKEFDVGADWLLYGDERNKDFPCGEKMNEYLKGHPEKREIVWKWMNESGENEEN